MSTKSDLKTETTKEIPKYVKTYKTGSKKTYYGPNIEPKTNTRRSIETKINLNLPVFVDSKGVLYNSLYQPLNNYKQKLSTLSQKQENIDKVNHSERQKDEELTQEELIEKYEPKDLHALPKFPKNNDFESFDDYEQAVLNWEKEVNNKIGFLNLPVSMSRIWSRPFIGVDETQQTQNQDRMTRTGSVGSFGELNQRSSTDSTGKRQSMSKESVGERSKIRRSSSRISDKLFSFTGEIPKIMEGTNLLITDKKRWDNNLLALEPDPLYYDTIEEFEEAYLGWAQAILESTAVIPPHPSQFSDLYGIMTFEQKEKKELEKRAKDQARLFKESIRKKKKRGTLKTINQHLQWRKKLEMTVREPSGIYGKLAVEELLFKVHGRNGIQKKPPLLSNYSKKKIEKSDNKKNDNENENNNENFNGNNKIDMTFLTQTENSIPIKTVNKCINSTTNLYETIKKNQSYYKSNLKPLLGMLHGTLSKQNIIQIRSKVNNKNAKRDGILFVSLGCKFLRRTDLTGPMINKSMDCPSTIKDHSIEFKLSQYDSNEPIDLNSIKKDIKSKNKYKENILRIQYQNRSDILETAYQPKVYMDNRIENQRIFVEDIFKQNKFNFTIENTKKILQHDIFLDIFNEILEKKVEYQNKETTYLQVFASDINPDNFHIILQLFNDSSSYLTHTKVALFVSEALQLFEFSKILEKYIQENDLQNLYYIAKSMNFLSEIPINIYPYQSELFELTNQVLNCESDVIKINIFCHYYLSIIIKTMRNDETNVSYATIANQIESLRENIQQVLVKSLNTNQEFLSKEIYNGIGQRSTMVSTYCNFLLLYLLKVDDKGLRGLLQSEQTNLFNNIIELSKSKFEHVRLACSKIFEIFKNDTYWKESIFWNLIADLQVLINNLTPPPKPEDPDEDEKLEPFFISELIHSFFLSIYKDVDIQNSRYLLNPRIVTSLLTHLEYLCNENFLNNTLLLISEIMLKIVLQLNKSNLIICGNSVTQKTGKTPLKKLFVDYNLIQRILLLVKKSAQSLASMKANLLFMISTFARHHDIFEKIRKQENFYKDLYTITKDATTQDLSKQALKLFKESIYYHSGVIDQYKNSKIILNFFELLNLKNPYVVAYGLNTFYELFAMAENEIQRINQSKQPTRKNVKDSIKSMEKDVKSLSSMFLNNSLFVKFNMVYQKYGKKESGLIFVNLAKVYSQIINSPYYSKIYKRNIKKTAYQEGLKLFDQYITGLEDKNKKKKRTKINTSPKMKQSPQLAKLALKNHRSKSWFGKKKN
ncbi:sca1 complex scaffold protein scaa [Anaeramoeba flamelloides]|uniref:Sca1 complex scaffold protein scaa n=1 Tax=Anaeramoeba flamelloides TaxID=1746091 RepID=A0ABQ8YXE6_9EUKA|nr:sca1 complex scaffold protein scaa [Anaeramoeba flamelloides]